jgi:outer membrane protein assembly factor BamB
MGDERMTDHEPDEPTVEQDLPTVETDRPTLDGTPRLDQNDVGMATRPQESRSGRIPLPLALGALAVVAAIGLITVVMLPTDEVGLPEVTCGPGLSPDPVDPAVEPQAGEITEGWSRAGLDVAATPPVVLADVAVVASLGGDDDGSTVAFFELGDGSVVGSHEMPGRVWAAPAADERFAGGVVWVTDDGGMLFALGIDGDPVMSCALPSAGNAPLPVSNSAGELLVVGTDAGVVRAIDPATGEQRWARRVGDEGAAARSIATFSNTLAVGTSTGVLVVLDGTDGEVLGEATVGDEILAPPVVTPDGEFVAAALDGSVSRVDLTGATVWSTRLEGGVLGPMAVLDDELWVGSADGRLTRLDLVTGEVLDAVDLEASVDGGVIAIEGGVVSADDGGHVIVHAAGGREIGRIRVGGAVNGGIAVWDGGLLVADASGTLARLDLRPEQPTPEQPTEALAPDA